MKQAIVKFRKQFALSEETEDEKLKSIYLRIKTRHKNGGWGLWENTATSEKEKITSEFEVLVKNNVDEFINLLPVISDKSNNYLLDFTDYKLRVINLDFRYPERNLLVLIFTTPEYTIIDSLDKAILLTEGDVSLALLGKLDMGNPFFIELPDDVVIHTYRLV